MTGLMGDVASLKDNKGFAISDSEKPIETEYVTVTLKRRRYTQDLVDKVYEDKSISPSIKDTVRNDCSCSRSSITKRFLAFFPIVGVIRNYAWRSDLIYDIFAGLSVSFMHMPQGLALGVLASVPPVFGLYSSFFPAIFYIIFGTCRHVSMGTNAVLSLLTASIIETQMDSLMEIQAVANSTTSDPGSLTSSTIMSLEELNDYKVGVAAAVSFVSGIMLLALGLAKGGFLTNYFSTSFVGGFTTAAAFHIASSQIPRMLHIHIKVQAGAGKMVKMYIDIFTNIQDANPADVIASAISFVFLLGITVFINERYRAKLRVPVPVELIIVVGSTIISYFADLENTYGLGVVGDIPLGFPTPKLPNTDVMSKIVVESFVVAIIIFIMTITLAKLMAETYNYDIDDDQELVAYGLCNFLSSFFRCIPTSTAPPRTMILSNIGAKSTLNGLVTASFILLVLVTIGQLFTALPTAVLAVMIAVAVKDLLLRVLQLPVIWRLSKPDFLIWMITCLSSILLDLEYGIFIGVGVSFFTIIRTNQFTSGSVGGLSTSEDLVLLENTRDGVRENKLFRIFYFPSPLIFVNSERFSIEIYAKALNPLSLNTTSTAGQIDRNSPDQNEFSCSSPDGKHVDEDVKYVILECSAMTYIDISGANVLKNVCVKYKNVGVTLLLARCPTYTLDFLVRSGYFKIVDRSTVFYDVYDAINYACAVHDSAN